MDISLVICTRNRAAQLVPCLDAAISLRYPGSWELIVVDNGSCDNTSEIVHRFARNAAVSIRYVVEPRPGIGNARNAGVEASQGEIVAFTDDDCYVAKDFLAMAVRPFGDPRLGYVAGRVSLHDASDYPITINESLVPRAFPSAVYLPTGAVMGANMTFRRITLNDIGGFDPLFGTGSLFPAEDCDAAARASLAGWEGCYDPTIHVAHHHRRKADSIPSLLRSYDIGRGAYHAKLMLSCGAFWHGLRGWGELLKHGVLDVRHAEVSRLRRWPLRAYWESYGAVAYLWQWLCGRARACHQLKTIR